MTGSDDPYDPAEASHQALRAIRRELERHPIVTEVRGFPTGEFTQVVAQLDTARWDVDRQESTLTVRWFAGETADARPEFSFHYSDERTDFGWHHEPNPHVDDWGHFQVLEPATSEYVYEPQTFPSHDPTSLTWEVMSFLSSRLDSYGRS